MAGGTSRSEVDSGAYSGLQDSSIEGKGEEVWKMSSITMVASSLETEIYDVRGIEPKSEDSNLHRKVLRAASASSALM